MKGKKKEGIHCQRDLQDHHEWQVKWCRRGADSVVTLLYSPVSESKGDTGQGCA